IQSAFASGRAWAARSVTCRSELRIMPVLACRMACPAFALIAFNSASVNSMVRWFRWSSFSRSASAGAISATTFRWAWVSLTGKCCRETGIAISTPTSSMGQRRLQVGNPGEEDRIALVVVIRLEDEFVPVVRLWTIFQQPMQSLPFVARARQRPAEKLQPVVLARHQDVRCRENDVVAGEVGQ